MQVFFNPATSICNVLSAPNPQPNDRGALNQAILFHEALHGYTGYQDSQLQSRFGITVQFQSSNITDYLQDHVILGLPTACMEQEHAET
jgi:hypothetical protein